MLGLLGTKRKQNYLFLSTGIEICKGNWNFVFFNEASKLVSQLLDWKESTGSENMKSKIGTKQETENWEMSFVD